MPEKSDQSKTLALEIMPTGLSLITFEDDIPVECLAHAPLDDPDFESKAGAFRAVAEEKVGKGFKTHIWLSDEHVKLHCAMLRQTSRKDRRREAASALSAMTPYASTDLCFDLGATDGEGYTPIAAIPKEKMDEAVAFARKIQMNPVGVSTSDDVVGFSSRPAFRPLEVEKSAIAGQARAAGIAALIALPVFGLSGLVDLPGGTMSDGQVAYVATVLPQERPGEALNLAFPGMEQAVVRPRIATGQMAAPQAAPTPVGAAGSEAAVGVLDRAPRMSAPVMLHTDAPHLRQVSFVGDQPVVPSVPALNAAVPAEIVVTAPVVTATISRAMVAPVESAAIATVTPVDLYEPQAAPGAVFAARNGEWRDARPRVDSTPVEPMLKLTGVRALAARDFAPEAPSPSRGKGFADDAAVQVANIGEGVLVSKPAARVVTRVLQPGLTRVPLKRPGARLPEEAFDFSSLVPITSNGAGRDEAPSGITSMVPHGPVAGPRALQVPTFDAPVAVGADLRAARIERAEQQASAAEALRLLRPPPRDATPAPGGGVLQTVMPEMAPPVGDAADDVVLAERSGVDGPVFAAAPVMDVPAEQDAVATRGADASGAVLAAVEAPLVAVPPQRPSGAASPETIAEADGIAADLAAQIAAVAAATVETAPPPAREAAVPASAEAELNAAIARVAAETASLPRPPVRVNEADAAETDSARALAAVVAATAQVPRPPQRRSDRGGVELEAAIERVAAETEALPRPPVRVADAAPEPLGAEQQADRIAAELNAAIAAAASDGLRLARPPTRPESFAKIAALSDPDNPFASPQAVPLASLPIHRPGDLAARAARIRAARGPSTAAVAPTVAPGTTTPSNQLRIPTTARVARVATIEDGINLGGVSLIGIFGTSNARRALIRMPRGRYVQVQRGDRVSGWTVSAISEDSVRVHKGSQSSILRMPN